jgi:pSer/pThr/pTyr-binding forkhead associated (FHA) protein
MPVIAVNIMKVALVVALYGFLLYIARSMRGQVTGPPGESAASKKAPRRSASTGDETPPALPMERFVEVFDANGTATRHAIRGTSIVGRGSSADIHITDDYASDRHASFRVHGSALIVEDLGSTNGTTLEGNPLVGSAEVGSGTTLVFGRTKVVVI